MAREQAPDVERLTVDDTLVLLGDCRRLLAAGGLLVVNTVDLEFFTSLLPGGYVEDTPQALT